MIDRVAAAKKEPEKVAGLKGAKIARELEAEELRFAVTPREEIPWKRSR